MAIYGGIKANKAQKKLESLQTPVYQPNKAIGDYYQDALNRYMSNPYDTQAYGVAKNNAMAGTAAGLNALQGRRSALGSVGKLVGIQDQTLQKAAGAAEGQRINAFNQFGRATGMRASDDQKGFQYNELAPYDKQMSLLGAKASGYNKMMSAGINNMFNGAGNYIKQQGASDNTNQGASYYSSSSNNTWG